MNTIAYEDARNQFAELIERARQGEEFSITRNGEEVACLTAPKPTDREKVKQAFDAIEKASQGLSLKGMSIKEAIEEGRR